MLRVAMIHHRAGLMDGVSLEMEKWKRALEELGNDVSIIAGNESGKVDITLPFLSIDSDFDDVEHMISEFEKVLDGYELVIVENIWSLALREPVGIALEDFAKHSGKKFLGHHHDFWWERDREEDEILREHFPPDLPNVKHVVINTIAEEELFRRRGIKSFVVPNVIDTSVFKSLREDFRERLGISKGDVALLQATRVVRRKAIELSVDLASVLSEVLSDMVGRELYNGEKFTGRVFLVFGGMVEDEEYFKELEHLADIERVSVINAYPFVESGDYSFWDVYTLASVVTYPSILEGWGNQLLEALAARKPIVLFEYEVFKRDIKGSGIEYVSLGDVYTSEGDMVHVPRDVLRRAALRIRDMLFDPRLYERTVEKNYKVVEKKYSIPALKRTLKGILEVI